MSKKTNNESKEIEKYKDFKLGKAKKYNLEDITNLNINSVELRRLGKYNIITLEGKDNTFERKDNTNSILSSPLGNSVEDYILLKNTFNYFNKDIDISHFLKIFKDKEDKHFEFKKKKNLGVTLDINFKDKKLSETAAWKSWGLAEGSYASLIAIPAILVHPIFLIFEFMLATGMLEICEENKGKLYGLTNLIYKSGIFKDDPKKYLKKINKIEKKLNKNEKRCSLVKEEERKLNKLVSGDLEDEDNFKYLSSNINYVFDQKKKNEGKKYKLKKKKEKLKSKIEYLPSELSNYKGIHIIADSNIDNSYEQVMNFYKEILGFKLKEFDLKKGVSKILKAWKNYH